MVGKQGWLTTEVLEKPGFFKKLGFLHLDAADRHWKTIPPLTVKIEKASL